MGAGSGDRRAGLMPRFRRVPRRVWGAVAVGLAALVAVILLVLSGQGGTGDTPPRIAQSALRAAGSACGTRTPRPYRHVIWIWMENQNYDSIIGSPYAPFTNRLAARCGLAMNYHNITHPSLPNYIAATSGLTGKALDPFYPDCDPRPHCSTAARSLFAQAS